MMIFYGLIFVKILISINIHYNFRKRDDNLGSIYPNISHRPYTVCLYYNLLYFKVSYKSYIGLRVVGRGSWKDRDLDR